MYYKVGDAFYSADGRQMNVVILAGGAIWLEPTGRRLDALPEDAAALTVDSIKAALNGDEPKKPTTKRKSRKAKAQ